MFQNNHKQINKKKYKHIIRYLFFALTIGLVSCGVSKNQNQNKVKAVADFNEMYATLVDSKNPYQESEERINDIIHTLLKVSFDWNKSQMKGYAELTVKPHFYPVDSLVLDAKSMDILNVEISDVKTKKYSYDGKLLRIKLDKTYNRNDLYVVKINYIAKPEEWQVSGSSAITSDKGLYFINPKGNEDDFMPQIWTQGETESSSIWFPTIDAPNEKTTQEIFITVDNKYLTLSNGKLISSIKNNDGTRTDYWKQDLPHPPYLFMMAVGEFETIHDSVTLKSGKKIEVNYIVEKEWAKYARDIFGQTPAMILFFSELLGVEYPWDKYHQIIVREYVSGAMENTTAVIHGDYFYKTKRELIDDDDQSTIAHELFHHWFGDLVTCESWSNLPLNESFANYSQYLWDEYRYGKDQADYYAEIEENGYKKSAQYQGHHNLIWFKYSDKENMFDGHSYNKGGRILHMLRDYLGDEAFFESLKMYLNENKFQPAEVHQLRLAFEKVSGKDLNPFFNQWFFGKGHPMLQISQKKEQNKLQIKIDQIQDLKRFKLFEIPIKLEIHTSNGIEKHTIIVDKKENTFHFLFTGKLLNIKLDPNRSILCDRKETKPIEQYIYQYKNQTCYKDRKDAVIAFANSEKIEINKLLFQVLKDSFWGIRNLALEYSEKLYEIDKEKFYNELVNLVKNDSKSSVRSIALNYLFELYNNKKETKILLDKALLDSSYKVVSSAIYSLSKYNRKEDLQKLKHFEKEEDENIKSILVEIYSIYGEIEKKAYFQKILRDKKTSNNLKENTIYEYTSLLAKQPVAQVSKNLDLYIETANSGNKETKDICLSSLEELNIAYDKYIEVLNSKKEKCKKENKKEEVNNIIEEVQKVENTIELILKIKDKIQLID